jgi:hypothetical protein
MEKGIVAKNVLLKNMKKKTTENQLASPELYYQILKECVGKEMITTGDLALKFAIREKASTFKYMEELQFIKLNDNLVELLPHGFSTYLAISSQKQSAENARKSLKFATWALVISAASFIASIVFNILLCK